MLMITKKRIRIANVRETDDIVNDEEAPNFSSQATVSLAMNPYRRCKEVPISKLKDISSKVTSTRKLGVKSPLVESGIRRKSPEIDGSMRELSYMEPVSQFGNVLRTANCARMDLKSSEGGVEIAELIKPVQRDIEAALILVQLSNSDSGSLKTKMQSPLSKGDCLTQRNQNRRKVGGGSTLLQLEYVHNDVIEQDNLYKKYGKCRTKGLSLLKLKEAAERTCIGRQVEVDHHCIEAEKVLQETELPISSLKRKEVRKSSVKKRGLKKVKAEPGSFEGPTAYPSFSISKVGNSTVQEPKRPSKKLQFSSICPISQTGFSFSIIHFLSAIRMAMITADAKDDPLAISKYPAKSNPKSLIRFYERKGISNSPGEQKSLPCLTIHEIVKRVRLNPGDPCILEAREPLQELVRGALTLFSSTTAPLGTKALNALTLYSKLNKSWSWIGPVASKSHDHIKEAISSEAWGLPNSTLMKLVKSFADWLKVAQESLQKIGDLPEPPLSLMHQINVNERFRGIRSRKVVATISQYPKEIRDYFRKEEAVRYCVPDRAFSYTALDGRKSAVAPLRRCSGKPSLKCREHFMLKPDRPPNITVLSLVRDAAARLPANRGTRADLCILIRDSQYIVEDISEEQLSQVVSGALDRLHYEHDPCVQFNGEWRLWFYLHGDREEDDFEYDADLSTKKRRRKQEIP